MKKKLLSILLCVAMTATLVTGCGSETASGTTGGSAETGEAESTEAGTASDEEDNVIRIGVVCAMTGGSAIYGEGAQNAVDLAVEEINSSDSPIKVEIVNNGQVVDDAKDSKQAVNAYNSLMPEEPEAVVGSFFSSVTLPMAELANEQEMLLLATGATNYKVTLVGPTIFRNCFIDPYQGKMATLFAKDQGASKVAIIYAKDDDYSNGLKDAFLENAEANGLEIVYTGECTTTDTDFTAQASQAVASGADFLFYPCFLDTAPAVQNFVSKYTEKYGDESLNACAALYYDAIYMLVQAAEEGGGTDTESLVESMTGMTFTGVGGTFTLDENGDPEKSVAINTYENGEVKWFKTLSPEGE